MSKIKPFTRGVEDCRHTIREQTVGGGQEYVKWLENLHKPRVAPEAEEKDFKPIAQAFKRKNSRE